MGSRDRQSEGHLPPPLTPPPLSFSNGASRLKFGGLSGTPEQRPGGCKGESTPFGTTTPNHNFETPRSFLSSDSLTPRSSIAKVPFDVRELDSERFKGLRADAAHSNRRNRPGAGEEDEDSYHVMVTPTVARALANVNAMAKSQSSGGQLPSARRRFEYSEPPAVKPDADDRPLWPEEGTAPFAGLQNAEHLQQPSPPPPGPGSRQQTPRSMVAKFPGEGEIQGSAQRRSPHATPPKHVPPNLRAHFEARSPAAILRAAGESMPKSRTSYEITPNPLYNEPKSPRNVTPVEFNDGKGLEEQASVQEVEREVPERHADDHIGGVNAKQAGMQPRRADAATARAGGGGCSKMTHRRTFSIDLDVAKVQDGLAAAKGEEVQCRVQIALPKPSKEFPSENATQNAQVHGEPLVSPAGSVEVSDEASPTDAAGSGSKLWRKPGYSFPELTPSTSSTFSFRPLGGAAAARGARPQHPAITKLSPRSREAASAGTTSSQLHSVSLPEEVAQPAVHSPTDSSLASSPDRTEYKDGVNSPNSAIRAQIAQTPWLSKVQDFISSPSCSGESTRSEAPKSRLSPRTVEVPASRLVSSGKGEGGGFGSPLTASEASMAKPMQSPVHRSDTASSWSIAANIPSGCSGQAKPWRVDSAPDHLKLLGDPKPAGTSAQRLSKSTGYGKWMMLALLISVGLGAFHLACSDQSPRECVASYIADPLTGSWLPASGAWSGDQQPSRNGFVSKLLRSIRHAKRAVFGSPPLRSTQVAVLECSDFDCLPSPLHEDVSADFPYASWFLALKDRARASFECEGAGWACALKTWTARFGKVVGSLLHLAGNQGLQDIPLTRGYLPTYFAALSHRPDGDKGSPGEPGSDALAALQTQPEIKNEGEDGSSSIPEAFTREDTEGAGSEGHEPESQEAVDEPGSGSEPSTLSGPGVHSSQDAEHQSEPEPQESWEAEGMPAQQEALSSDGAETASEELPQEDLPADVEQSSESPHEASEDQSVVPEEEGAGSTTKAPVQNGKRGVLYQAGTAALGALAVLASGLAYARIFSKERRQADWSSEDEEHQLAEVSEPVPSSTPPNKEPRQSPLAKEPSSTWLASKLTPNRLSKVDSPPSKLVFRQMRDRTVVTADGKQVGDLAPGAHHPSEERFSTPTGEVPSEGRARRTSVRKSSVAKATESVRTATRSKRVTEALAVEELDDVDEPQPRRTRRTTRSGAKF